MSMDPLFIRIIYAANILVAGGFGLITLFFPDMARRFTFGGAWRPHPAMQLVGCFWLAIAVLSAVALFSPWVFSPLLLIQLLYKSFWILFWAIPVLTTGDKSRIPIGMLLFFLIWVGILAIGIPWRYVFRTFIHGAEAGL